MFEKDPRTFSKDFKNLAPEQKALVKLEITLSNFFKDFDKSVTRWERLVYPALIIFGMLGVSGFYLIYNVTMDMHQVASHVDPQMETNMGKMASNMDHLSQNIAQMTSQLTTLVTTIERMESNIGQMSINVEHMSSNVGQMSTNVGDIGQDMQTMRVSLGEVSQYMGSITGNIGEINQSAQAMTTATSTMSRDMWRMNESIGRPMGFFNSFAPW